MFGQNYCKSYILLLCYLDLDSRSEAEQPKAHLKRLQDENIELLKETPPILFIIQFLPPKCIIKLGNQTAMMN